MLRLIAALCVAIVVTLSASAIARPHSYYPNAVSKRYEQRIDKLEHGLDAWRTYARKCRLQAKRNADSIAYWKAQTEHYRYDARLAYYKGLRDGAHKLTHAQMIEALEAAPVTLEQLLYMERNGIGYGQILVRP